MATMKSPTSKSVVHPMAELSPLAALTETSAEEVAELDTAPDAVEDDQDYIERADGSVLVLDKETPSERESEFDENLAEWLEPDVLSALGRRFCDLIESDKKAREDRDRQYAEGIKRTGMSGTKKPGADFDGASSVTSPTLAKGCVDFASKAAKELLPSNGPVRTQIIGDQTDVKIERAERKKTYMNWQLTEQIPEHRSEIEKVLSQLPLGGSQYKRWWYDQKMGRARTAAAYIDDIFLPYDQNDFYTTPRLTHREFIGATEYDSRCASGLYVDDVVVVGDATPDRSASDKAARDVEGVSDDAAIYTHDGETRQVYTVYADIELEDDGGELLPYVLHISEHGQRVLGVFRNWSESDKRRRKLHWIVEYNFIPWRGAYSIGLAHLIGSMSVAATGSLNALLDAAHINNFPGGLRLKGGRNSGQSVSVNATELREIDAPPGVDDIRKLVMAFPFNGPSAVLYSLLEWLTQQAETVVSTASEKIAEAGANMPMGTALALIEGGSTNFSAIHARLHHSARRELEILHRLNATYLEDQQTVDELGELIVYREDFKGPMDVLPVSDPNIFSEAQRYAQLQAVMQLEALPEFKPFFKPERLLTRALKLLQISYADDIANLPRDPQRLNPVDENAAAASDDGSPLKVYADQDDLAHLESHALFMSSPLLGASPLVGPSALPKLLAHCKEHIVAYYKKHHRAATEALLVIAAQQQHQISPQIAESKAHAWADQQMATALAPLVAPALEKATQMAMQFAPKPPADGNVQATLAAQAQMKQLELEAKQKDADSERKFKASEAAADRLAHSSEKEQDRTSNENAAAIAAAIEKMQTESTEQTARLTLSMQQALAQSAEQNKLELAALKSQSEASLLVLQNLLIARTPEPVDGKARIDTTGPALQELASALQTNAVQMAEQLKAQSDQSMSVLSKLIEGMTYLSQAQMAPREAHYIKDQATGKTLGVRSVPVQLQ